MWELGYLEYFMHIKGNLTVKKIESPLAPGRYGDGSGLHLIVKKSGAKSWVLRTVVRGHRVDIGLGGLSYTSLQDARQKAHEFRSIARNGGDPRIKRDNSIPTFKELAESVYQERLPTWKNKKHASQWINTLRDYTFDEIGSLNVDNIDSSHVLKIISPIWSSKHETARRVMQRVGVILDVARAKKYREGENPISEIKSLGVLPKINIQPKHHSAMKWQDLPKFYSLLSERSETAAKALCFTILTAARTSETLGATWDEIEDDIWIIQPERMKAGRLHEVPLSFESLEVLKTQLGVSDKVIFEGQKRHRPLSNMAMENVLRRMDVKSVGVTVHGFRSTFRDWASEVAGASREVAEAALAHNTKSKTEAAYARSTLLEKRRSLMERWAQYVTGASGQVVHIHG